VEAWRIGEFMLAIVILPTVFSLLLCGGVTLFYQRVYQVSEDPENTEHADAAYAMTTLVSPYSTTLVSIFRLHHNRAKSCEEELAVLIPPDDPTRHPSESSDLPLAVWAFDATAGSIHTLSELTGKSQQTERVGQAGQAGHVGKTEQAEQAEPAERAERGEQAGQPGQAERGEQAGQAGRPERAEHAAQAERAERAERAEQPQSSETPADPPAMVAVEWVSGGGDGADACVLRVASAAEESPSTLSGSPKAA